MTQEQSKEFMSTNRQRQEKGRAEMGSDGKRVRCKDNCRNDRKKRASGKARARYG